MLRALFRDEGESMGNKIHNEGIYNVATRTEQC